MKKSLLALLGLALALSLVLINPQPAQAFDWLAPTITPVSGDKDFTSTPAALFTLPGILPNDNGIILPTGFTAGTAQFGGEGVVVSGFSGGTANLCYIIPAARYEWVGSIHQWTGGKWTRVPTAITEGGIESASASACAAIHADGTYALIMGFTGQPEALGPQQCDASLAINGWSYYTISPGWELNPGTHYMNLLKQIDLNTHLPVGTLVTYSILNIDPPGSMTGALTVTGTVTKSTLDRSTILFSNYDGGTPDPADNWLFTDGFLSTQHFTMHFTLPTCTKDFPNPYAQ